MIVENSRIESKIDKLDDRLVSIDRTLVQQQVLLDEHIRRTNLLEAEIKPIKRHVDMVTGAMKMIGLLATGMGIAAALLKVLK